MVAGQSRCGGAGPERVVSLEIEDERGGRTIVTLA